MSKPLSKLFKQTLGHIVSILKKIFRISSSESTAEVWNHIHATQGNYPGTQLPRSFTVDTPAGKMWTHGNATKHMNEALFSVRENPALKNSNPKLYTQFILYDYYRSLGQAVQNGIEYGHKINTGNWEFVFAKARGTDNLPVVKHAKFSGLT